MTDPAMVKYKIGAKISGGGFGEIYVGYDGTTGTQVAFKLECQEEIRARLKHEYRVYKALAGGVGIPGSHALGITGGRTALVVDLLGPSVQDLFRFCGHKFSLKTVLMLADQMISRLEYMHSKSLIHRDVKPENFVMGIGNESTQVYVIDFGLTKYFEDPKSRRHIRHSGNRDLVGTTYYASRNAHWGFSLSRRDDMESLGYALVYLARGSLPWDKQMSEDRKRKLELIEEKKMTTSIEEICHGLPDAFSRYLNHTMRLFFDAKPDYSYLRGLFHDLFINEGFENDGHFDWDRRKSSESAPAVETANSN